MAIPKFVEVRGDDWIATVKDAKRYRWLRDTKADGTWALIVDNLHGDKWDEAIDAAIAAADDRTEE